MRAVLNPAAVFAAAVLFGGAPALTAQAAPEKVQVTPGKESATISWAPIKDETVTFKVLRGKDPRLPGDVLTEKPLGPSVTSFTDPKPPAAGTIYYQVVAVYGGKVEAPAKPVMYVVPSPPTPPAFTAPALGAAGPLNFVTLTWPSTVPAAGETISFVVRKLNTDPAATPAGAAPGYVTGAPTGTPGGQYLLTDHTANMEAPTWYKLVATSTTRGSAEGAWVRRDPVPHRGVDTIIGGFWRELVPVGSQSVVRWVGCIRYSLVAGAADYAVRVRVGNGAWIAIPASDPTGRMPATPGRSKFSTDNSVFAAMLQPLEAGGVPQFQAWPRYLPGGAGHGAFVPDTAHLTPAVYTFAQIAPLNQGTCTP